MHTTRRNSRKGMYDYLIILLTFLFLIFMVCFFFYKMNEIKEKEIIAQTNLASYKNAYHDYKNRYETVDTFNKNLMEDNVFLIESNEELKINVENKIEDYLNNIKNYGGSFKSFTDYRCLSKSTPNYKLCASATVDNNGLLVSDGAYLVAMGTGWDVTLGTEFYIILDTGVNFKVKICDVKADKDTDASNKYTVSNNCMLEFYVDRNKLNKNADKSGNISSISMFKGDIIGVIRVG